jgi:hypothetical protein
VARRFDPYVRPTPPQVGTRLSTRCLRQCPRAIVTDNAANG